MEMADNREAVRTLQRHLVCRSLLDNVGLKDFGCEKAADRRHEAMCCEPCAVRVGTQRQSYAAGCQSVIGRNHPDPSLRELSSVAGLVLAVSHAISMCGVSPSGRPGYSAVLLGIPRPFGATSRRDNPGSSAKRMKGDASKRSSVRLSPDWASLLERKG